ncbi:MAG: hypothetical protein K0Q79_3760 [Flavipsychrobacter sp.]|jgi:predicted nuclease of predicted toxin-antitoxin system|nr:hypothetical protein [Flavipsychrobacter sp.]
MEIWIDAQLSPALALWINQTYPNIKSCSLRSLNLRNAGDEEIFKKAKEKNVILMSKNSDFVKLLERFGSPPQIIWITAGNTSNAHMRQILTKHFTTIIEMLNSGETLIEIGTV